MATILIIHGAWSAGWAWKKMRPLLRELGHEVFTPTCSGLGERAHQADLAVDLDSHIADMRAVLRFEDLRDVVLVGHSYGGMVATGVADRDTARIAQLVYLDAFVPRDGQCLFDLVPAAARAHNHDAVRGGRGDGWRIPVNPMPPDTPAADLQWATPLRQPMPLKCLELAVAAERCRRVLAAQLHLLQPQRARGCVQALCRARTREPRLAMFRARRQPQPAYHDAADAGRAVAPHRHERAFGRPILDAPLYGKPGNWGVPSTPRRHSGDIPDCSGVRPAGPQSESQTPPLEPPMSTPNLSTVATQVIESYGITAINVINSYRFGGERIVGFVDQRFATALNRGASLLRKDLRANLIDTQQRVSGYYVKGLQFGAERAETAVGVAVDLASKGVGLVSANAGRYDAAARALQVLNRVAMPAASVVGAVVGRIEKGSSELVRRVSGTAMPAKAVATRKLSTLTREAAAGRKRVVKATTKRVGKAVAKTATRTSNAARRVARKASATAKAA